MFADLIPDLVRLGTGSAAVPLSMALWFWHRLRTTKCAVLDVEVRPLPDSAAREAWLQSLRRVVHAPAVVGVLFRFEGAPGGWAANQDLRTVIGQLREAGKATYALLEAPGNAQVWLATACDKVFAVPTSELNLVGVGVELNFFGATLERLGVEPDFEAAGAYKSFGEPFTRSFASPANLEAMGVLVEDLHGQLVADIASDRDREVDEIQAALASAPLPAEEAKEAGLVDQLLYKDQLDSWLEETHGEDVGRVDFDEWALRDGWLETFSQWGKGGKSIAVVHLDGSIVMDDKSSKTRIRARTVVPILEKLRKDDSVAGVVLHVNSPGGSALASDLIWREVEQLRMAKPVVASFEDVAASGGYYLSAPAAEIFARPATLTGSIGVFGGKLVLGGALRKAGVASQSILAAPNATLFSPSRPFTDPQRERFRGLLQRFYDGFVQRVAAGRRQPEESIEPHCRGRVWTGRLAEERGLVDTMGTLADAVERTRVLASLPLRHRRQDVSGQPQRSFVQRMISDAIKESVPGMARANALLQRVSGVRELAMLELLADHEGRALALLPVDIHPR